VAIILVIAAIAFQSCALAHAANEARGCLLRSINTSQIVYQSTYGPASPQSLRPHDGGLRNCAPPNTPTATAACLIDAALASGTKSGYTFLYTPSP